MERIKNHGVVPPTTREVIWQSIFCRVREGVLTEYVISVVQEDTRAEQLTVVGAWSRNGAQMQFGLHYSGYCPREVGEQAQQLVDAKRKQGYDVMQWTDLDVLLNDPRASVWDPLPV